MHSTARGAQENLNNLWFNPNFDKRLSGVEYHIRFHRTTKSINQFNTLKCSELENMEFYIGIFIFFNRCLVEFLVYPG